MAVRARGDLRRLPLWRLAQKAGLWWSHCSKFST